MTEGRFDPTCGLLGKDVFQKINPLTVRQICYDFQLLRYEEQLIILNEPDQHYSTININSHGFRGPEISKQKDDNTYRIMFMGGSTAFGSGSTSDNTTITGLLQQKFNNANLSKNVEVVNAGVSGFYSLTEIFYIKNFLLEFEPDLFIVYDGFNDEGFSQEVQELEFKYVEKPENTFDFFKETLKQFPDYRTPYVIYRNLFNENNDNIEITKINETRMHENIQLWKNRWTDICELGKHKGFSTIITVQPMLATGKKSLSHDESERLETANSSFIYRQNLFFDNMVLSLKDLDQVCNKTADLKDIFENTSDPIYFDFGHMSDEGNGIIATKLFELSLPIVQNHN